MVFKNHIRFFSKNHNFFILCFHFIFPVDREGYLFVKLILFCCCVTFSVANFVCPVVVVFNFIFYFVFQFVLVACFLLSVFFFRYLVIS